jgi:hypothetical protein
MSKDIRVLIIKLADRLHNMRTLEYMPTNKRTSKAMETLEIYAPLAGRLGMFSIKFELEDLALKFLHPIEYKKLSDAVTIKKEKYEKKDFYLLMKDIYNDKFQEELEKFPEDIQEENQIMFFKEIEQYLKSPDNDYKIPTVSFTEGKTVIKFSETQKVSGQLYEGIQHRDRSRQTGRHQTRRQHGHPAHRPSGHHGVHQMQTGQ